MLLCAACTMGGRRCYMGARGCYECCCGVLWILLHLLLWQPLCILWFLQWDDVDAARCSDISVDAVCGRLNTIKPNAMACTQHV